MPMKCEMEPRPGRIVLFVFAAVAAFVFVAGGLIVLFPGPRRDTDYLVIGTLATFATLVTIFIVVVTGVFKESGGVFFKRRGTND
jgi:hypothetical protein